MLRFPGRTFVAVLFGIVAVIGAPASKEAPQAGPPGSASVLNADELDQLLAPIALYPDPLVAQILMAATYPLEVVEADRWLQNPTNAALKGNALAAALQNEPWDPSIKSLVPFPQLLHMMNTNLQWTEQLGDAFLAQQDDVMDAVQRLRRRAQAAGSLASTPQQTVTTEDQEIMIEPANPDVVYVPAYNPCVYGAWPDADYPPFYFGEWAGSCVPADSFVVFGPAFYPFGFWAWGRFEWRRHAIHVDADRFQRFHSGHEPAATGIWQHDPAHRHGVPYRGPATAVRFPGPGEAARRASRGFAPAPAVVPQVRPAAPTVERTPAAPSIERAVPQIVRPPAALAAPRPTSPAFESFGRGAQVRSEAARGLSSRMSSPAPSFHPAPAPSFHAAPAPSAGARHR